ncbi:hypothetical protein J2S00_003058 [Caldalkalibacillus uzonensis]|uniref:Uncharacterized protein n=1 Tax=Caldalkalibacillus uzonensis TaxID=353224 RepID=A0ABU0CV04_9BACI|nr:hypothetical protein [Caldalkalibacillus uzonensis]MDQ0340253.1 hypothetical protein [Caldalkalibacillus uzonensis]
MVTKVSSAALGEVKFPMVDSPPGEVHEYKLTPEQLAEIHKKYGPPNKNKGKKGARSPILTNYEAHQRKKRRKRQGKSFPLTKEEYLKLKE